MKQTLLLTLLLTAALSVSACKERATTMMVQNPTSFETAEGVKAGAAFMTLHNMGTADDELVFVTSDVSKTAELHEMVDENGIMRMRKIENVKIPAGAEVTLSPEATHIMLMDLKAPLKANTDIKLKLHFKESHSIETIVPVRSHQENTTPQKEMSGHEHH